MSGATIKGSVLGSLYYKFVVNLVAEDLNYRPRRQAFWTQ